MPQLVGRQPVHVRKDRWIVYEQRDDRRAEGFAVCPGSCVDVGLREPHTFSVGIVVNRQCSTRLLGARTSHSRLLGFRGTVDFRICARGA